MRNKKGQYQFKPFKNSNFLPLWIMLGIMATGAYLDYRFQPLQATLSPCDVPFCYVPHVSKVQASEPITDTRSIKDQAIEYIYKIFGDDASKMVTIIGECENKGWNPKAVNTNRNGSKDYNLAQVNDLNGKRDKQCKGLDYKNNWKDNLDCAKIIKDSQGLQAWSCSYLVGVDPFYMRSK